MARGRSHRTATMVALSRTEAAEEQARTFGGLAPEQAVNNARMIVFAYERRRDEMLTTNPELLDAADPLEIATKAAGILGAMDQRRLAAAAQVSLAAKHGEIELRGDLISDADQARELLLVCNQRAVGKWARKFQGQGMDVEDLIQEGNAGLMRAVERYDHTSEASFLTYANWWIRQAMLRAIQERGSAIPLPSYLDAVKLRVVRAQRALEAQGHHDLSLQQIIDEVNSNRDEGVNEEHIRLAVEALERRVISMDAQRGSDDDYSLADRIPDPQAIVEGDIEAEVMHAEVHKLVDALPANERALVERIWGLNGHEATSARELAKELGISRQAIGRTIERVRRRMADQLTRAGLTPGALPSDR